MKDVNTALRKNDTEKLHALGLSDVTIEKLKEPDFGGRPGFPGYMLTNNNGNIRRLKKRLEELDKHTDNETTAEMVGSVEIIDNVEENRLQLVFPGKPSEEIRTQLKRFGFRWSPTSGAWQRQRSNAASVFGRQIAEKAASV